MEVIDFDNARDTLTAAPDDHARLCGRVIAESAFDGVPSHSLAAVSRVIGQMKNGAITASASPERVGGSGPMERWDGRSGIGIVNATKCTSRAMELAAVHGIGCVGLKNTKHWLRAGSYGWQAARSGFALICWTNTQPNIPAWGADERRWVIILW